MAIGTLLQHRGVLTSAQLERAIAEQRASGERLDRVLIRMGLVSREQILAAVGDQFHLPVVDLATSEVDPGVLRLLPAKMVFKQRCVPLRKEAGVLTVATADPYDLTVLDELRLLTGCPVELALADEEQLSEFIRTNYGVGGDTLDAMAGEGGTLVEAKPADEADQAQEASVIKLVNDLLSEAIEQRATDVHIEPYERTLAVRYRIDGVLERANVPPAIHRFGAAIVSRLKIMASLNIAEKRRPQDGRITFKHRPPQGGQGKEFDLRVSVIPMLFGEGVVLRVLSKTAALMPLEELGMPEGVRERWGKLITRPHGILLVTGPTGSGKSTTLYASLNRIVSDAIKVITVEDPVEYQVPGINQIQVNHKVGVDFSSGLRAILRHDPDVVMIGEIRDKETAEIAVQASLTGHLVFSTLHTNDAPGSITRLLDMGVEPFLVSSSLEGVLAQRLVRRVCDACGAAHVPDEHERKGVSGLPEGAVLRKGAGCRACRQTGYRGRLGVYELLTVAERTRQQITERRPSPEIAAAGKAAGDFWALYEDGMTKVLAGKTTLEEVLSALSE